jgi:hypothetical protein
MRSRFLKKSFVNVPGRSVSTHSGAMRRARRWPPTGTVYAPPGWADAPAKNNLSIGVSGRTQPRRRAEEQNSCVPGRITVFGQATAHVSGRRGRTLRLAAFQLGSLGNMS